MNLLKPPFQEGIHWRRLTSEERNGRPWKYKTITAIHYRFKTPICYGTYYLRDGDGMVWGTIAPQRITVAAGYAWNGSSFSPDLKGVLSASLVHDLLYQFSGVPMFPFSRNWCDNLFFAACDSPLAFAYRLGLFVGSWSCWGQHEPGCHIITENIHE